MRNDIFRCTLEPNNTKAYTYITPFMSCACKNVFYCISWRHELPSMGLYESIKTISNQTQGLNHNWNYWFLYVLCFWDSPLQTHLYSDGFFKMSKNTIPVCRILRVNMNAHNHSVVYNSHVWKEITMNDNFNEKISEKTHKWFFVGARLSKWNSCTPRLQKKRKKEWQTT